MQCGCFVICFNINKHGYFTAGLYSLLHSTVRYSMIEENETGRTRGMYVGEEKCRVSVEKLLKGDHLEDLGVDGRLILFWILSRAWARLNWPRMVTSGGLL